MNHNNVEWAAVAVDDSMTHRPSMESKKEEIESAVVAAVVVRWMEMMASLTNCCWCSSRDG